MAKAAQHVVCTQCFVGQDHPLKQTFLGFYTFTCRSCGASCKYPLSTTYRVIYGLLAIMLLWWFVSLFLAMLSPNPDLAQARGGCCGCFSLGAVIALAFDFGIRSKVENAKAKERPPSAAIADTFR